MSGPTAAPAHHRAHDPPTHRQVGSAVEAAVDLAATLSCFVHGRADPTTCLHTAGRGAHTSGVFLRATHTPDGPGTLQLRWTPDVARRPDLVDVATFGPGGDWLAGRVPSMLGALDPGADDLRHAPHPVVARAARRGRGLRIAASGDLYHELLPTVVEQRITSREAKRQWRRLCERLGEPAPGPFPALRLPPEPRRLAALPSWWFHPLGIERRRAEALRQVARRAGDLWGWSSLPSERLDVRLRQLPGVGVWTSGTVRGPAVGDADALAVGDYHLKHLVAHALASEPRGTDERMLHLLRPYAGQRGRVVRLLRAAGHAAPAFGPRQRILPMHRW